MKHLKRFNESLEPNDVEELKDFCENCLAYLLDDGYNVSVTSRYPDKPSIVSLDLTGLRTFYWNDVKDYYIPFLQMLQRRYELRRYELRKKQKKILRYELQRHGLLDVSAYICAHCEGEGDTASVFRYLSLDQVINDKTGLDYPIFGIYLQIVDKI